MLLGILSVIALGIGTVQSVNEIDDAERLALQDNQPVIVQTVEPVSGPVYQDPDLGL